MEAVNYEKAWFFMKIMMNLTYSASLFLKHNLKI